jgi:hypothetical protein
MKRQKRRCHQTRGQGEYGNGNFVGRLAHTMCNKYGTNLGVWLSWSKHPIKNSCWGEGLNWDILARFVTKATIRPLATSKNVSR